MSSFGKPNATGRSSGIHTGRQRKIRSIPKGEPFVQHTREMTASDAWRCRSINVARLIDFLEIEHMNHAGTENGNLIATHSQLMRWGIGNRYIRVTIDEAKFLGLIRVRHGGRYAGRNDANRFTLTYLAQKPDQECFLIEPSNEWKRRSELEIKQWRQEKKVKKEAEKVARKNRSTPTKVVYRTQRR